MIAQAITHVLTLSAGLTVGFLLWEILRRPRLVKRVTLRTLENLDEEISKSALKTSFGFMLNAVALAGPRDGFEFTVPADLNHAVIDGHRYDFTSRTTKDGRWVFRFNPRHKEAA
jgi:hypothetical protein